MMRSFVYLLAVTASAVAEFPRSLPSPLALPSHPRLILTPDRIATIAAAVASNEQAASFYADTLAQGEYLLSVGPLPHPAPNTTGDARYALQRIYTLSILWALTRNATWAARATQEALVVATWPCFDVPCGEAQLNTGEAMHALGVALDWLYGYLDEADRATLVSGMVTGLASVAAAYKDPPPPWAAAFVNTTSNWNMVVNGGTIIGCLSVAGEAGVPAWVTESLLPAALTTIHESIAGFAPDGGWQEGPNYAGYGTRYFVPVSFSLLSALGPAYNLLTEPGVDGAATFALSHLTPRKEDWAWDDSPAIPETRSQHLGLAGYFNQSGVAAAFRLWVQAVPVPPSSTDVVAMNYPVALLYFTPIGDNATVDALPRHAHFAAQHVFALRSSWRDPGAAFTGWQGSNISWAWAHGNLHGGAFVFQSRGQWWAEDLGHDNYALPQYFWVNRFDLYRTNSLGHNTLTFDGLSQACVVTGKYSSRCPVVPMTQLNVSTPDAPLPNGVDAFAVVNATGAWAAAGLASVQRGFVASQNVSQLLIVDEIAMAPVPSSGDSSSANAPPKTVQWRLHTVANVTLAPDATSALLTSNATNFTVAVSLVPASTVCPGAAFSVIPVILLPPQLPCTGCSLLQLSAPAAGCTRITVSIGEQAPRAASEPVAPAVASRAWARVLPLAQWGARGPLE